MTLEPLGPLPSWGWWGIERVERWLPSRGSFGSNHRRPPRGGCLELTESLGPDGRTNEGGGAGRAFVSQKGIVHQVVSIPEDQRSARVL